MRNKLAEDYLFGWREANFLLLSPSGLVHYGIKKMPGVVQLGKAKDQNCPFWMQTVECDRR